MDKVQAWKEGFREDNISVSVYFVVGFHKDWNRSVLKAWIRRQVHCLSLRPR